jgi:hypothetical protein
MGFGLKNGKNWISPNTGAIYANAYLKIGDINYYSKDLRSISFFILIFNSHADRLANKSPVHTQQMAINGDQFDLYVSPSAIKNGHTNLHEKIYNYLIDLININESNLIFTDWQNDI